MEPGDRLVEFIAVMDRLRRECPWKSEQTHRSLARYLLEETHEVLEALDTGDDEHLREELGDLLMQIYFHARIAEENAQDAWSIDDVAAGIIDKLVRRNPHVFGDQSPGDGRAPVDADAVNEAWNEIKASEKRRDSVLDGLAPTLPALLYADKVIDRLAEAGVPVEVERASADLGERLLGLVAEARAAKVDPEQALRDAVRRHTQGR